MKRENDGGQLLWPCLFVVVYDFCNTLPSHLGLKHPIVSVYILLITCVYSSQLSNYQVHVFVSIDEDVEF